MDERLPAHVEVASAIRRVQGAGGFAMVLQKGERDAGTILFVLVEKGENARLYERMPTLDGDRKWTISKQQITDNPHEFTDYVERRGGQDPDAWIVELDIADGERFIDAAS